MGSSNAIRGAAVLVTCAAFAYSGAASAQTFGHADPAHDVVRLAIRGAPGAQPRPANKTSDIRWFQVTHTHNQVRAKIRLQAKSKLEWEWRERLRTPSTHYDLSAGKVPGSPLSLSLYTPTGPHTSARRPVQGCQRWLGRS